MIFNQQKKRRFLSRVLQFNSDNELVPRFPECIRFPSTRAQHERTLRLLMYLDLCEQLGRLPNKQEWIENNDGPECA